MAPRKGYERKTHELLPPHKFALRLAFNTLGVLALLAVALAFGMAGYMFYEHMNVVDAFVNAAMILSGMGPLSQLHTDGGKVFAGAYAIGAGITFVFATALLLSPLAHRFLHKFHLDDAAFDE